jgi:hypothetical protein
MNALAEDQLDRLRGCSPGEASPSACTSARRPTTRPPACAGERLPSGSVQRRLPRAPRRGASGRPDHACPPRGASQPRRRCAPRGQPRILLTNVKQLELLLTRGRDVGLFADGAPLEFLVFDEAHTFRAPRAPRPPASSGACVPSAGKASDEVTCVATSATMADPKRGTEAGRDFARRFFGVDAERVTLVGEAYDELRWDPASDATLGPPTRAAMLARGARRRRRCPTSRRGRGSRRASPLGGAAPSVAAWQSRLRRAAPSQRAGLPDRVRLLRRAAGAHRPGPRASPAGGSPGGSHEVLAWLALGAACARDGHDPLLRPVVHSFVRGVGGAVVTFRPGRQPRGCGSPGEDAKPRRWAHGWPRFRCSRAPPAGSTTTRPGQGLHPRGRFSGRPSGGDQVGPRSVWPPKAESPRGRRALFVDRTGGDARRGRRRRPRRRGPRRRRPRFEHRSAAPLWLCTSLRRAPGRPIGCARCQQRGALVAVQVVRFNDATRRGCTRAWRARPRVAGCGGQYREPARPVRAVAVSDVHVLAQSMLHHAERRA